MKEHQLNLWRTDRAANFEAAVKLLNPIVIPLLWKAHRDTLEDLGDRIQRDPCFERLEVSERAQFMHRQVVVRLQQLLSDYGGSQNYMWFRRHRMDVLNVGDQVHLSFKKLRHDLRRSNYDTAHNLGYWTQSGSESTLKLVAGYRPNATWNDARFYLTLPTGPGGRYVSEWVPIEDQTTRLIQLTALGVPAAVPEAPKRFAISARPKTGVARRKKAGGSDVS